MNTDDRRSWRWRLLTALLAGAIGVALMVGACAVAVSGTWLRSRHEYLFESADEIHLFFGMSFFFGGQSYLYRLSAILGSLGVVFHLIGHLEWPRTTHLRRLSGAVLGAGIGCVAMAAEYAHFGYGGPADIDRVVSDFAGAFREPWRADHYLIYGIFFGVTFLVGSRVPLGRALISVTLAGIGVVTVVRTLPLSWNGEQMICADAGRGWTGAFLLVCFGIAMPLSSGLTESSMACLGRSCSGSRPKAHETEGSAASQSPPA